MLQKNKFVSYGWFVCSLAALFYCYEYLLRIEPSVMFQPLMQHFNVTAGTLSIVIAMYYYAYTPLQAAVGIITDVWGAKRVLIIAIGLCALGCFGFQQTHNIYLAGLSRFLIGAGSAFAFVGVLKLAALWLPAQRFAFFVGLTTTLGMFGAMVGDVGMAWIVHAFGWRQVIIISAVIGIFLIIIFSVFIRKDPPKDENEPLHFRKLVHEFLNILKNRQIIYAGIIGCLLYLSLSVFGEMWGIPFIISITHKTNIVAAQINSAVFFGWLVGAPLSGWLSDRINSRKKPLIFGSFIATVCISVILIWPTMSTLLLLTTLFLFGLSGSAQVICFAVARDNVSIHFTATGLAIINLLVMVGGMLLQPLVGELLDLFWRGQTENGVRIYDSLSYRYALIIIPVSMLLAAFLSFLLKDNFQTQAVSHGHK